MLWSEGAVEMKVKLSVEVGCMSDIWSVSCKETIGFRKGTNESLIVVQSTSRKAVEDLQQTFARGTE